jgi:hypothetical protein
MSDHRAEIWRRLAACVGVGEDFAGGSEFLGRHEALVCRHDPLNTEVPVSGYSKPA